MAIWSWYEKKYEVNFVYCTNVAARKSLQVRKFSERSQYVTEQNIVLRRASGDRLRERENEW